jgi:hypothetical protein
LANPYHRGRGPGGGEFTSAPNTAKDVSAVVKKHQKKTGIDAAIERTRKAQARQARIDAAPKKSLDEMRAADPYRGNSTYVTKV